MGCIFFARGERFDVDEFLAASGLPHPEVFRQGEPRFKSRPDELNNLSGFTIRTGAAGFNDFEQQVAEAIAYLNENADDLQRLDQRADVESKGLDFGIRWKSTYTHTDTLSATLVQLAGRFGLSIAVSHYPIGVERNEQRMIRLQGIQTAIRKLSPEELARFRAWFAEYDGQVWDREFEMDVAAGRLDALAEDALYELYVRRAIEAGLADSRTGRMIDRAEARRQFGLDNEREAPESGK